MLYKQNRRVSKEIKNLKRNQKEILQLKNTVAEMKNSLEGLRSSFEWAEERVSESESRTVGVSGSEQQKEEKWKRGTSVAQLFEWLTLPQVTISLLEGSSPMSGSVLTAHSSEPGACFRFCLCLCPSPAQALSLSQM